MVWIHVGAPKTGTTFIQRVLWKNREALAANGVLYPMERRGEHRLMTLDLRQIPWGGKWNPQAEGAWDQVAERVRAWNGHTAVLSNELLGGATEQQARRAVESLQPAEVHVIFTARDLARQLPSDWQEQVKHKHAVPLQRFIDDLVELEIDAPHPFGRMFWGLHDPVRVLGSWSAAVPPERVHVVTVPQPGAPKDTLWKRFAGLVGLDPEGYETEVRKANTSMGAAETELVRRVNGRLEGQLRGHYDQLVRVHLAETVLAERSASSRNVLPAEYDAWALERSKRLIEGIRDAGYDVVGDLDELLPAVPSSRSESAGDTDPAELLDASLDSVVGLLVRVRHARERAERAEKKLAHVLESTSLPEGAEAEVSDHYHPVVGKPGALRRRAASIASQLRRPR